PDERRTGRAINGLPQITPGTPPRGHNEGRRCADRPLLRHHHARRSHPGWRARPPALVTSRPALRLGALVAVMFFTVSGGPFGLEGLVGSVGPGVAILLLVGSPLIYSVPEALLIGELASMLAAEGGYY